MLSLNFFQFEIEVYMEKLSKSIINESFSLISKKREDAGKKIG